MEQPSAAHPLLDAPQYILEWPSWCAWAAPTKRPLDLKRFLKGASVTEPDTWASFGLARAHLGRVGEVRSSIPVAAGVGILVAAPLVFVDFDDLMEPGEPATAAWAHEFLTRAANMGAFTELSGSGTGAHAFVRTTPQFPVLTRNRYTRSNDRGQPVGVEVYAKERFAALTGHQYAPGARPALNDPAAGEKLLLAFLADISARGAPILTPEVVPISVSKPSQAVLGVAATLLAGRVLSAFEDPQREYAAWADDRLKSNTDNSLSAWRFSLYLSAARGSTLSPAPLYELFNPQGEPLHPGVPEWQEFSGYLKKRHRVYVDVQRAHALVQEEQRLLAQDLGEPAPVAAASRPSVKRHAATQEAVDSWAQMGLVLKTTDRGGAFPLPTSVNFIRVLDRHSYFRQYRIERNRLDGTTRVNREPISDTFPTRCLEPMRSILDMHKDPPIESIWSAIEVVADDHAYDPLVEYLDALPAVDAAVEPLLSSWLSKIGAAPSHDLARFSRRILVGLVARALKPGIKFDYVPVFEGPQGVGKSTLVERIVSTPFYAVMVGDLQSKDALVSLRGKWGIELAELQSFRRSDEEARKAFFSTATDSFRPPYGRANVTVERRTVLFGTTNDKRYMTDYTGARRYLPVEFPVPIDVRWFVEHRDQLFAEAKAAFLAGEAFHDTWDEQNAPDRLAMAEARMVTPAWHVRIIEHLTRLPTPHVADEQRIGFSGIVTTQDVANLRTTLDLPGAVQNMSDAQLASFLRRAGFHPHPISWKKDSTSRRTYGWAHPALQHLDDGERKAFLSNFPALFEGEPPPSWVLLQEQHLANAVNKLQSGVVPRYDEKE